MSGTDRVIDLATRDYVDDGLGGWVATSTIAPQIHHQVLSRRGKWPGDPDSGCDLYLVPRKADQDSLIQRQEAVHRALQTFVDAGQAEGLIVAIERDQANRPVLSATIRDVQYGEINLSAVASFGLGEGA